MSVQRIVEDSPAIELQAEAQHTSGEVETPVIDIASLSHFNINNTKFVYQSVEAKMRTQNLSIYFH